MKKTEPRPAKEKAELFSEIDAHLMNDLRPSFFLSQITRYSVFGEYPFDMLKKLGETKQSPVFHPEGDVWAHTLMVVDEAARAKHKSKNPRALMFAALLHDIGKPETFAYKSGRITAYNHDRVGARLAVCFLREFTTDAAFIDEVSGLIKWHMQILYAVKGMKFAALAEMRKETDVEELALIGLCDRMGRGGADREKETYNIELFLEKCYAVV